ncbi:16174_t:CDS:2, partial [Cetraspora pellucida]
QYRRISSDNEVQGGTLEYKVYPSTRPRRKRNILLYNALDLLFHPQPRSIEDRATSSIFFAVSFDSDGVGPNDVEVDHFSYDIDVRQ